MNPVALRNFTGEAVRLLINGKQYVGRLTSEGSEFYLAQIVGLNHLGGFDVTNGYAVTFDAGMVTEIRRLDLGGRFATPHARRGLAIS